MKSLAATFLCLSLCDALATSVLLDLQLSEGNPLALSLYKILGPGGMYSLKVVSVTAFMSSMLAIASKKPHIAEGLMRWTNLTLTVILAISLAVAKYLVSL